MREEVEIEHVPMGQVVRERTAPWEDGDTLIVPVYEEQLVVVKRLVLKEQIRIRRVARTETQVYEDTLRRERLEIDDPSQEGMIREQYPTEQYPSERREREGDPRFVEPAVPRDEEPQEGNFFEKLVKRALQ